MIKPKRSTLTKKTRDDWTSLQVKVSEALERDQINRLNAELETVELAASKREYGTVWRIVNFIAGQPKREIQTRKLDGKIPTPKRIHWQSGAHILTHCSTIETSTQIWQTIHIGSRGWPKDQDQPNLSPWSWQSTQSRLCDDSRFDQKWRQIYC